MGASQLAVGEAQLFHLFFGEGERGRVGGFQNVVAETQCQRRQQTVDFAEAILLVGGDVGTVAHKVLVGLLGQTQLFAFEAQCFALVVDRLHTLEELGVEHDVIAVCRHQRGGLLGNFLHLVGADALAEVEEYRRHLVEEGAALLEGFDGVLEGGCLAVVHDGVDFGLLLLHALFESRHIVLGFDFLKRGDVVRGVPFSEERVVHVILVFAGSSQ